MKKRLNEVVRRGNTYGDTTLSSIVRGHLADLLDQIEARFGDRPLWKLSDEEAKELWTMLKQDDSF